MLKEFNQSICLTEGPILSNMLRFAFPLMVGNLLQQLYNIVDTLIVGRYLGETALAAVGSAYTLMIFLASIICGLCMGSGVCFSIQFGRNDLERLQQSIFISAVSIAVITMLMNICIYVLLDGIVRFMRIPEETIEMFRSYLFIIFMGLSASFLYNYLANLLRAVGNSMIPLVFLAVSALSNVGLDLVFVLVFRWGVHGAAAATVVSQYLSAVGILIYYIRSCPQLHLDRRHRKWDGTLFRELAGMATLTCVQQSIMNFGILMVQGLVNSFGTVVMAAFASGVKIDTVAYAPVQDFGNAFSTYIAQNYGAGKRERIQEGIRMAGAVVVVFCLVVSGTVFILANGLMMIFVQAEQTEIIAVGCQYLRVEGACYVGIGILFLLYGYYRAVKKPLMSVVLTVISLGTRVVLAYMFSPVPALGVKAIWIAIPVGWLLADVTGVLYGIRKKQ